MFTDIGKKIMNLAKVACILGIIVSIIYGIILISNSNSYYDNGMTGAGFTVILVGSLGSWLGSFVIYAFGQLTDDIHAMREENVSITAQKNEASAKDENVQSEE